MVDSKEKGARAEIQVRDLLRKYTGYKWERVPLSGALSVNHQMKGDLYSPGYDCNYCIEVKHYADDHLTSKILTSKNPQLIQWWEQTIRQAGETNKEPLLFFKHDRSKVFVATYEKLPIVPSMFIKYMDYDIFVYEATEKCIKELYL